MVAKNFEASAVNLCNPPEVKALLEKLSTKTKEHHDLNDEIMRANVELVEKTAGLADEIADLRTKIKEAIEEHGSYQSLEDERYGVQYARRSEVYNLDPFKTQFPKFVGLCIRESIDVTALKGQIKGKLITVKELEDAGVLDYTINYAFYVR